MSNMISENDLLIQIGNYRNDIKEYDRIYNSNRDMKSLFDLSLAIGIMKGLLLTINEYHPARDFIHTMDIKVRNYIDEMEIQFSK